MITATIRAIEYYLPDAILDNEQLSAGFEHWSAEKIEDKTGVVERHIAAPGECASDLAVRAAERLFESGACDPRTVDYLLLCTQSPDYLLPTTACLLQHRLGIPTTCGAIDFNQGCSGYVYGLGLVKGLIESGQAGRVLLLTAETYSKYIHPGDKSVRTVFGDGASVTLLEGKEASVPAIGPFVFGTDGGGAEHLIVPTGGARQAIVPDAEATVDKSGNVRTVNHLYMNGGEIFGFTLKIVPHSVSLLLERSRLSLDDVDLFVFHQANRFMLEHLRKKLHVPQEKFVIAMSHTGNTVSSTIPIALKQCADAGRLRGGARVMLLGFGVGYSWSGAMVRWE